MLSVMFNWSSSLVGGLGLDLGKFMLDYAGVAAFVFPLSGILIGLGLLLSKTVKFLKVCLYLFVFSFVFILFSSVWFEGRLTGDVGRIVGPFAVKSVGKLGVFLFILALLAFLFIALDLDRFIPRLRLPSFRFPSFRRKRRSRRPFHRAASSEVISEDDDEKDERSASSFSEESSLKNRGESGFVENPVPVKRRTNTEADIALAESPSSDAGEKGGIEIVEGGGDLANILGVKEETKDEEAPLPLARRSYKLPDVSLFKPFKKEKPKVNPKVLEAKALLLEEKLRDFGVSGKVVSIHYGPVVSMFEYKPAPGVKISKIVNLQDDIALVMKAGSVRVVAPIPGKDTVGIELPNDERETVYFSEIAASDVFKEASSFLTLILGKDIFGKPFVSDLRKMPHLLVAGATGSGKSVALNAMICSILFKATPEDVKFILVDPKMLEFSVYNGIPHLITPVITDPKKAASALSWVVSEMERRYSLLTQEGVRSIERYNLKAANPLPYIVIVIDELADLMMVAGKDVELHIARLAQKARAAGIHIIVATQRPSVDVITGLIKANFPSRISFKVSSRVDSRTILDVMGAEKLLGNGDMLFMPPGKSELIRLHGAYISDSEIEAIAEFWRRQAQPEYSEEIFAKPTLNGCGVQEDYDELYEEAVEFVTRLGYASASLLQRRFKIGYNRAARLIEMMEKNGIVGPAQGSKPREVLKKPEDNPSD